MLEEVWKDIPQYEGLYQVSNLGRVKSLDRKVIQWNRFKNIEVIYKGKILKPKTTNRGYLQIGLTKNNKTKNFNIHRLVAVVFLKDYDENLTVDHIDCDKENNKVENLRMVTIKENIQLSYKNKLHKLRKVGKYDLNNNLLEVYESCSEASRENKCSSSLIGDCCNPNKCNKTGVGYIWRYIDE